MEEKKERYKCKKCGSKRLTLKKQDSRVSLYCLDCQKWVTWTDDKLIKSDFEYVKQFDENKSLVLTKNYNYKNKITRKCSCGCLLYTFGAKAPDGQFDLNNARYCPICGGQLI